MFSLLSQTWRKLNARIQLQRERERVVAELTATTAEPEAPEIRYYCYHCQHGSTFWGVNALYVILGGAYKHHLDHNHDVELQVRALEGSMEPVLIHWARRPEEGEL